VARAKNGQAICADRRTEEALARLNALLNEAKANGDLETWRRDQAVTRYLKGRTVISLCDELGVVRASVNRWLKWYNAQGAAPKLTQNQRLALARLVKAGPQAAGFTLWDVDRADGRRLNPPALWRELSFPPRLLLIAPNGVLRPAAAQALGEGGRGSASYMAERAPSRNKKKRLNAEA
jgi:hypothetical protein